MKLLVMVGLLMPFLSLPVWADSTRFSDTARVLDVTPVMENVLSPVTRRICYPPEGNDAIAGSIGEDIRRQQRRWEQEGRCETVREEIYRKRINGYRVTYRYAGHTNTVHMDHDPGERLPVRVGISPND